MGLFDMFSVKKEEFTPIKICVISMIYLYKVDGDIGSEEVGQLLSIVGGKSTAKGVEVGGQSKGFIDDCVNYTTKNNVAKFLSTASAKLTEAQKLYIITNMIDASLSDGKAHEKEELLIEQFVDSFGIDTSALGAIFQVLELKNDRKIFADENYEKNSPDFKFVVSF